MHGELSGHFRDAVLMSFRDKAHVNAFALYNAITGAGTKDRVVVQTICACDNQEIVELKKAYEDSKSRFAHVPVYREGPCSAFVWTCVCVPQTAWSTQCVFFLREKEQDPAKRNLEKDVAGDTSGDYKRVLVALLQGQREEQTAKANVVADCEALYTAGEGKMGTDESVFVRILANRSHGHIREINKVYSAAMGHDLIKAIKKETSGHFKECLEIIVKTALNKAECIADMLLGSMKGLGTNDDDLIRLVLAYSEDNLEDVKKVFLQKNEKSLADYIRGDTSGDYKKFLVAIVGDKRTEFAICAYPVWSIRCLTVTFLGSLNLQDLYSKLRGELSGNFRDAVLMSFLDKAHINALALYNAITGVGTNDRVVIQTICACDSGEIEDLKKAYED
ncbi:unnamed protein product, partial [Schistocephalus solidus]